MLSKYYNCLNPLKENDTNNSEFIYQRIKELFPNGTVNQIHPGGTLGVFYKIKIDNKYKFMKTHINNEMQKNNLQKELEIMSKLYKADLEIDSFTIDDRGMERLFLLMDFIKPIEKPRSISFIQEMVERYTSNLTSGDYINYNMDDLINASKHSYDTLTEKNLLTITNGKECEKAFLRMPQYASLKKIICHGDLSNANIMENNGRFYALDWEDALWGYQGYDILYWLTFYSQRKYYDKDLFRRIKIDKQFGKDMMILILLVKSYLSYRNGTYLSNKLSINDRISEVIQL